MSQLAASDGQPGNWEEPGFFLRRLETVRFQENGWQEPYESRGSRTVLRGTGGETPPVYPTLWSMINMDNIKKHQKYKKRKYFRSLLTFNNKVALNNVSAFYTKEGDLDGKKIFYLDNTLCLLLLIKL